MPVPRIFAFVAAGWLVASASAAFGQQPPLPVDEAFAFSTSRTAAGDAALRWDIADGYYLYRDKIEARNADGSPVEIVTSPGEPKEDPYFGRMEVYHREASATVAAKDSSASSPIEVTYQGCQDNGICYRPVTKSVDLAALGTVAAIPGTPASNALSDFVGGGAGWKGPAQSAPIATAPSTPIVAAQSAPAPDAPPVADPAGLPPAAPGASGIVTDGAGGGLVADLLSDGGTVWVVAMFLFLGLGLAFTPCVFPMYPILAGQLSRSGERLSPARGFLVSAVFVGAMASAFGLLGIAAAWSGQNLQIALQSDIAIVLVSAIFVLLALSMFGLFELRLPSAWTSAVGRTAFGRQGSLKASAALGFTSALIVGPCVTAPLAGGLLYIANTGDLALGAAALFALGLGQGLPLIAFGTLGASALPKGGPWMAAVMRIFGFAFLALAIWMLSRILPAGVALGLWSALLVGAGVFLGAFDLIGAEASGGRRAAKAGGLLSIVYGAILAVGAAAGADDPLRPLATLGAGPQAAQAPTFQSVVSAPQLSTLVAEDKGPSLLYFTADWCVSCDVIKKEVFENSTVRAELAGLRLLEADVSDDDPEQRTLMAELGVVGPPTMLFVDGNGREVPGTRLVGYITAPTFLESVRLAKGK